MNYIINPSWFYWINVADGVKNAFSIAAVMIGLCSFLLAIWVIISASIEQTDYTLSDSFKKQTRALVIMLLSFVVAFLLAVFVPSKNTLIEMQIANYATHENAEWTVDAIKGVVDYIVNAIQSLK
jgi:hypothetical protein